MSQLLYNRKLESRLFTLSLKTFNEINAITGVDRFIVAPSGYYGICDLWTLTDVYNKTSKEHVFQLAGYDSQLNLIWMAELNSIHASFGLTFGSNSILVSVSMNNSPQTNTLLEYDSESGYKIGHYNSPSPTSMMFSLNSQPQPILNQGNEYIFSLGATSNTIDLIRLDY